MAGQIPARSSGSSWWKENPREYPSLAREETTKRLHFVQLRRQGAVLACSVALSRSAHECYNFSEILLHHLHRLRVRRQLQRQVRVVARQDLLSHPALVAHQQCPFFFPPAVEVCVPKRPHVHAAQQVLQVAGKCVPGGIAVCASQPTKTAELSGKDEEEKQKERNHAWGRSSRAWRACGGSGRPRVPPSASPRPPAAPPATGRPRGGCAWCRPRSRGAPPALRIIFFLLFPEPNFWCKNQTKIPTFSSSVTHRR